MNSTGLKYASSLVALAMCAACSGGQAGAPPAGALNYQYVGRTLFVNGRPTTAARLSPIPRYATMLVPDAHSKSKDYEYIFNAYGTYASIFDYPKSDQEIGQIAGDGGQGCTNALYGYGKRIFWNVGGPTAITEYRVPKKPLRTLSVNYAFASSCAMDKNGDLAVGILYNDSKPGGGDVIIFPKGSSKGTAYPTPLDEEFFDGYDPDGNLFADGFTGDRSGFALVELPVGAKKFVTVTTSNAPNFPGSVQWDGTYLTVFDQTASAMYQYNVSGTKATLRHTISFTGDSDCAQMWNVGSLVYCGDAGNDDGEVYKYPGGGSPIATFTGEFDQPLGVTAATK
jgi:hypothetical protein